MSMIDLFIAVLAIALVIFTLSRFIKSAKGSSSDGCSGCCGGSCPAKPEEETKK